MTNKKNIQDELSSLESVKEIVKTGNIYPNLYSQMSYAISDLQKEEQGILDEIKELYGNQGDFIVPKILESIHHAFIFEFMDGDGNMGDAEEEVTITRKRLFGFSGDIYATIDAVNHLMSVFNRIKYMQVIESRIELAKKGVLI